MFAFACCQCLPFRLRANNRTRTNSSAEFASRQAFRKRPSHKRKLWRLDNQQPKNAAFPTGTRQLKHARDEKSTRYEDNEERKGTKRLRRMRPPSTTSSIRGFLKRVLTDRSPRASRQRTRTSGVGERVSKTRRPGAAVGACFPLPCDFCVSEKCQTFQPA